MSSRCSTASREAGESMAGTAPAACSWIVLEHRGPWGARVLTDGALPDAVASHLADATAHGVTVLLARRPDARPHQAGTRAWIARSIPGGTLMREGDLDSLLDVLSWDIAGIGRGELPPFGSVSSDPVHFVCTNGTRDQCCAIEGRALLSELLTDSRTPATAASRLWESSHIGGHRFAPVMLTLPSGAVHGRLTLESAQEVLKRSLHGEIHLDHYRGRSGLAAPLQAVAIEARRRFDFAGTDDIDVLRVINGKAVPITPCLTIADDAVDAEVRHHDGRAWRAIVTHAAAQGSRPESCGKDPAPIRAWVVTDLQPVPDWA